MRKGRKITGKKAKNHREMQRAKITAKTSRDIAAKLTAKLAKNHWEKTGKRREKFRLKQVNINNINYLSTNQFFPNTLQISHSENRKPETDHQALIIAFLRLAPGAEKSAAPGHDQAFNRALADRAGLAGPAIDLELDGK